MSCVVRGCKSHSSRKEYNEDLLTFHRFPKDDVKKNEWIYRIGRRNWTPKNHSHICSKHFTLDSFVCNEITKWRRLREDAVPTLFILDGTGEMELLTEVCEDGHSASPPLQGTAQHQQQSHTYLTGRLKSLTLLKRRTNSEINYLQRNKMLEKELEKVKKISKRRLRKINTLTKRLSRLEKKNKDLYNILITRIKQENVETEYSE